MSISTYLRCLRRGHLWTSAEICARCSKGIPKDQRPKDFHE